MRTTLARGLVVGALACFGLLTGASIALAQEVVGGTNVANGTAGISGPVAAGNTGAAIGGPASSSLAGGVAAAQMTGDTNTTVEQNTVGASGPAAAGSQVHRPGVGSITQDTNVSTGALAVSGPVVVSNATAAHSGPASVAAGGGVAASSQFGDVETVVEQDALGVSGPATAGSQIAESGVGNAILGVNVSTGALSLSGPVFVGNALGVQTGPSAIAALGGTAVTGQVGDDDAFLTQAAAGASGDATSGSQVTGGLFGVATPVNSSTGAAAASGPVAVGNLLASIAGPSALAFGPGSLSSSTHGGNTSVTGSQVTGSASGNAVVGSQVYGLASSELGVLDVPSQLASDPDFFQPNTTNANQVADALAAAQAADGTNSEQIQKQEDQPDLIESIAQIWNALGSFWSLLQALLGGGAIPGVPGGVIPGVPAPTQPAPGTPAPGTGTPAIPPIPGVPTPGTGAIPALPGGVSSVHSTNVSAGNAGASGPAVSLNAGLAIAGPASASATVVGPVPAITPAGDAVATSAMTGDASTTIDQDSGSLSGNATVASQTAAPGLASLIADVNVAEGNVGASGPAVTLNTGAATSGPLAAAGMITNAATAGDAIGSATQFGNAASDLDQDATAASGDATSGSQVEGTLVSLGVLANNFNVSRFGAAFTGPAISANGGLVTAGPSAAALGFMPGVLALTGDNVVASASQVGNDGALLDQGATASSGDAATGSQVFDILGLALLQNVNVSEAALSATGPAVSLNSGTSAAGPAAGAAAVDSGALASAGQWGDDRSTGLQRALSWSGEAAAGSQDLEGLAGALVSQDHNVSNGAVATSGLALSANLGTGHTGPLAGAVAAAGGGAVALGDVIATAAQVGSDNLVFSQISGSASGDTLAGSQGAVVLGAGLLTDLNVSTGSLASSGNAVTVDVTVDTAGPAAAAAATGSADPANVGDASAFAFQAGNDTSATSQTGLALTGDAVAGSQLRASLAGLGQARNIATNSTARSGDSFMVTALGSTAGPYALALGSNVDALSASGQVGDDAMLINQIGVTASGNAGAGSQIDGGILGLLLGTNVTAGAVATTGTVFGLNFLPFVDSGPAALSAGGVSTAGQVGNDVTTFLQLFGAISGDVYVGTQTSGLPVIAFLLYGRSVLELAALILPAELVDLFESLVGFAI